MPDTNIVSGGRLASMQRIVVKGPPGDGKSTLARDLEKQYGLPVFHLDQTVWQSGWVRTPADYFRSQMERIAALPAWVIDGNYIDTIHPRFAAANLVIYLDVPSWLSVLRLLWRTFVSYGRVRVDAASGCAAGATHVGRFSQLVVSCRLSLRNERRLFRNKLLYLPADWQNLHLMRLP